MTSLDRVRVSWGGTFPGAPGVSTFYFLDATTHLTHLKDIWGLMGAYLPDDSNVTVEGAGEQIESTTGEAIGSWTATAPATVTGGSSSVYGAATGCILRWLTSTYFSGRRLAGRTFMVPLASNAFSTDGALANAFLTTARGAAASQLALFAGDLVVWQRPRVATPAWTDKYGRTHAAVTARGGGYASVTSSTVPDYSAVLRSRRD